MLTDDVLAHPTVGDQRPFKRYDGHHQYEQEHFWDWAPERNVTTGAIRLTDYNFKKTPAQAMEVDRLGDAAYAQGQIESFDYPGDYPAQDVGRLVAGLRTEQERGADRRIRAVGDCTSLGAGCGSRCRATRCRARARPICAFRPATISSARLTVRAAGQRRLCVHRFIHINARHRADGLPPRTPVAVVQGPQTAEVVGEGEIDCDEYGRILVRFHWDLANAIPCAAGCRKTGPAPAGAAWSSQGSAWRCWSSSSKAIPTSRGGGECVQRQERRALSAAGAQDQGGVAIQDPHRRGLQRDQLRGSKVGQENIAVHAQKDQTLKVLNNRMKRGVDNDQIESVGQNKSIEVGSNHQGTHRRLDEPDCRRRQAGAVRGAGGACRAGRPATR